VSGLISNDISAALKKDAEESNKPRRESGEYEVEVTSVAIADNPTTWIEKALMVEAKFLDDIGGTEKVRIELAPCTARDGGLSPGKIKFLRWQLGALGLDADEIAFQLFGIIGNRYKGRYTVDDGLNEDGSLKRPNANLNPHTGKPYINRDLIFLEKLESTKQDADAEAPDETPEEEA
jgi:hypothetical protein